MSAIHAVTGAFGFSGKYITQRLLVAGKQVITLTNSLHRPNPFNEHVAAVPFNFSHPEVMAESLQGVEVLYNTYWVRFNHERLDDVSFTHNMAVNNTLALFEAAKLAGVKRFVHVSITSADESSPYEYFQGKGFLERKLKESGLSYAIVRPAVLFGSEDILINNIAWMLRHFPVFAMFGDGSYHVHPIYVDDLAALMIKLGEQRTNVMVNALGPENYTYRDLVHMIRDTLGIFRPVVGMPPMLGYLVGRLAGKLVGDVVVTKPEVEALMANTLHAPGATPTGQVKLSEWVEAHKNEIGKTYANELARRRDRALAY